MDKANSLPAPLLSKRIYLNRHISEQNPEARNGIQKKDKNALDRA